MTRLKLNWLKIVGFKGLKSFELTLDGDNAVIVGENETKKTTIKDAFHWLLFDKSSDGKPSSGKGHFGLRPHYRNGKDMHGVTVMVELEMAFDGEMHVLRKEQTENIVKGKIIGYPNQYYLDGAPVLKKKYDEFLNGYISEDIFRLLTDVFYFCGALHHQKRREFLVQFAENAGKPEGFDGLLERANVQNLQDYKKALVFQRDGTKDREGYKKELEKIPTRIETILQGLEHPACDVAELEKSRVGLGTEIQQLKILRQGLVGKETERQKKQEEGFQLSKKRIEREAELATDTSGTKALFDEKSQIIVEVGKAEQLINTAENELNIATAKKTAVENEQASLLASLNTIRGEYNLADVNIGPSVCYACGAKLSKDKLVLNEEKRQARLNEITARGDELKRKVDENKKYVVALSENIKLLTKALEEAKSDLQQEFDCAEKRLAEIDEAIIARPRPKPEDDDLWQKIVAEIAKVEKEIGPPVSEQLEAIESERTTKETELTALNEELAQADRIVKDRARIIELEAREKELAQLIADIDKEIDLIKQYNLAYSKLVETAVNDKFQYVTFKLFDIQINGDIDDRVCEAMIDGTKWLDMSTGQSIRAGLDIINILSEHYGVSVPMFIDHSESMTLPIEAHSQTIELFAQKGVKQLQVQTKSEKAVA